jgi:4-hydroxymandelate oxidase
MDPSPYVQVDDYEPVARSKLPEDLWDFYAGGAGDERTLADNVRAFDRWILRPRVLRGASTPDTATTLLGWPLSCPILVAPWAFQRRAHPDGEAAVVRAAGRVGTIAVISSTAADHAEEVAAAATGPVWWQLYLFADVGRSAELLRRVADAGFGAICWTVDLPVLGLRHRDTRRGFEPPVPVGAEDHAYEPALTWEHLSLIRDHAPGLPVVVKGILTGEDGALAVDHCADAIVHTRPASCRAPAGSGTSARTPGART